MRGATTVGFGVTLGQAAAINGNIDEKNADGTIFEQPQWKVRRHQCAQIVHLEGAAVRRDAGADAAPFFKNSQRAGERGVLGNDAVNQRENVHSFEARAAFGERRAEDVPEIEDQMKSEDDDCGSIERIALPSVNHDRRLIMNILPVGL